VSDLVWAVTDGPDGLNAVSMPEDRYEALALKATHSELFWCGTAARGCGARLIVAAGPKNRPHFRHHVGSGCRFIDQPYRAGAAYEHLQYQRSLQRWLEEQGYRPTLERHLREDGRTWSAPASPDT
jgi:competence CoiA-like predicted nuclease